MTGLYGVIGDPIAHSLSPLIHNGWMRDLGIDGVYSGLHVRAGETEDGLSALSRQGFLGLNVTLPHKSAVIPVCETLSDLARRLGAVNTLTRTDSGGWHGHNTDHDGFLQDFAAALGTSLCGQRVLVLGAGGAARALIHGLASSGAEVTLSNRTVETAEKLAEAAGLAADRVIALGDARSAMAGVDSVVNALSIGHGGGRLDLADGDGRLLYDISYGKAAASVLDHAAECGWRTADGLGMLVAQAALSFELWHGVAPDRAAAEDRCRTALKAVI